MLLRFSLSLKGGLEVFSYSNENLKTDNTENQLFSGLFEAMQMMSETMKKKIQVIQFADTLLYFRAYSDFTLRMLVDDALSEEELNSLFSEVASVTLNILAKHDGEIAFDSDEFSIILPTLSPLTKSQWKGDISVLTELKANRVSKSPIPRIIICGLGKVGKTSIKNIFFEKWTSEMVKNIKPTVGAVITTSFENYLKDNLTIIDLGGQGLYREENFSKDYLWTDLTAIVYVIDIQDRDGFKEAKEYLDRILEHVRKFNSREPKLALLFHKYDLLSQNKLLPNLNEGLEQFQEYLGRGIFFLTTIDDQSCVLALLKIIYLTVPLLILKRMLEEQFLDHFHEKIIPVVNDLLTKFADSPSESLLHEVYENSISIGRDYGKSLQKSWIESLTGRWRPKERPISAKTINIEQKGQYLYLTIDVENTDVNFLRIITVLLDGIVAGIFKTFFMGKPLISNRIASSITWKVSI